MEVNYSGYNHVLCNSIKPTYTIPSGLTFTLEDYIKSQLYFPLMPYSVERELKDYSRALTVIEDGVEDPEYLSSFYKVVNYFYRDLAVSIINAVDKYPDSKFDFYVTSAIEDLLPREQIDDSDIKKYIEKEHEELWRNKAEVLLQIANRKTTPVLIEMR